MDNSVTIEIKNHVRVDRAIDYLVHKLGCWGYQNGRWDEKSIMKCLMQEYAVKPDQPKKMRRPAYAVLCEGSPVTQGTPYASRYANRFTITPLPPVKKLDSGLVADIIGELSGY